MIKVALPNKGQLHEPARRMLTEAGYRQSRQPRDLMVVDPQNKIEFYLLRPKDIPTYVASGILDLGITGRDMLVNADVAAHEVLQLGFGPSRFFVAAPVGSFGRRRDLAGARVATSYPGLLRAFLAQEAIDAEVVRLDGAVENAVRLGVADAIADVVDTGTTLRQAGLETVGDPILESEAVLIRRDDAPVDREVDVMVRRLQGVLTAWTYVLVDYDIATGLVEAACALTPGIESPTVSQLHEPGWSAVRAVVPKTDVHRVMDELADMGGRGILVTAINAARM
ncbi:MAG: ATP phosphoribosyltransferase [Actinobacteria bacterium]|nr:ATP phosphoribosyltransferase [Actinomycetota bacterium]